MKGYFMAKNSFIAEVTFKTCISVNLFVSFALSPVIFFKNNVFIDFQ